MKKEVERKSNSESTILEHVVCLLPRLGNIETRGLPVWPPDAFALCLSLLQESAAYCTVLEDWPPSGNANTLEWAEQAENLGVEWRRMWVSGPSVPDAITSWWEVVLSSFGQPLSYIKQNFLLAQAILSICGAADEACVDAGTPVNRQIDEDDVDSYYDFRFAQKADKLLDRKFNGSSLCDEIDCARARVLPKQHTPQNGLTTRSLSLYIGLSLSHEVKPVWLQSGRYQDDESLNLLLIPWPYAIKRTQFQPKASLPKEMRNMSDQFGFFSFRQGTETKRLIELVFYFYEKAEAEFGKLGGVVLPEAAVSPGQFKKLRSELKNRGKRCLLIAGVGNSDKTGDLHDQNTVQIHIPDGDPVIQHKHHRWKLTRSQILQYNLGGVLTPGKNWWEHINIGNRSLTFITLLSTLTMAVLICEDLARPDPVGDVVRVVGPNLLIALLMDGPQLKERWPARHAITLADDPGCSVLAFTSIGMCTLSRPIKADETNRDRVIAIWKDPFEPAPKEIELPEGCGGVVLSLSLQDGTEWTADGRSTTSGSPRLTGVYPLGLPSQIPVELGSLKAQSRQNGKLKNQSKLDLRRLNAIKT